MARAKRTCARCPAIISSGTYCTTHTPNPWQTSTRAARLPRNWKTIRQQVLRRDGSRCQIAHPGCTGLATEVDHIRRGDDHAMTNLQSACRECHGVKTRAEAQAARRA